MWLFGGTLDELYIYLDSIFLRRNMERKSQYKVLFPKRNALNDFINYKRACSALSNPNINYEKLMKIRRVYASSILY